MKLWKLIEFLVYSNPHLQIYFILGKFFLVIIVSISIKSSYIRNPDKKKSGKEDDKQIYHILKNIGIENIRFYVMNKISCENDNELHEIENQYIKFYNPILNSSRPEPQQEYKNDDLIYINMIANNKNFPRIKYLCKCGLEFLFFNGAPHSQIISILFFFLFILHCTLLFSIISLSPSIIS